MLSIKTLILLFNYCVSSEVYRVFRKISIPFLSKKALIGYNGIKKHIDYA